ncbi:poly-beta-1,6 N-acetyl-D-glucosamine export porin PgaA [Variovorax paradoxus]|uniref:poly-beta-1,6 N-acetyl-D-glucosamine export porin PgaA n=1 Tax=Variovorax paradoxus TaxID=34073 RepID=UPI0024800C6E|nr:poly-beta-1,6 N-acetyl-D-glucosamine export porin PgaA [Variovorax paradoxus]WGT62447.1 poly-beta-1,6 N-acetyl-D-glucosamine export porin PgaA [Variovorax paradoxus]
MAACNSAQPDALPRHLAQTARVLSPLVCILAFGASAALANPGGIAAPAAADRSHASYDARQHDALIGAQRAGRITAARAFAQLKAWLAMPLSDAERQRMVSDAVVLAVDAGQFADAAALGRERSPARVNSYALGPLAGAARRAQDLALQGETVAVWRARLPDARDPRIHEGFWRLDSGDTAEARAIHRALAEPAPTETAERVALLELHAAIARAEGHPLEASLAYTEIAALQPASRDAHREAAFLLASNGAASPAFKDAEAAEQARPGTFSALALSTVQQQALAQQLRWAVRERDELVGPARVAALDKVLARQQGALTVLDASALRAEPMDTDAWRALRLRLESDRLLALVERGRPADAIAQYEMLRARGASLPPYALGAAARAFAEERRSSEAVPLFEAAVAAGNASLPMPDPIYLGLAYAYLDTGRFEEADALLTRIEAATPALMRLAPEVGRPNDQYTDMNGMRGMLLLYGDRHALAQQRFALLTGEAPLNSEFAAGAAQAERLRDHPEAALARFEALAADHPLDIGARTGHVEALLDAGEFAEARRRAASLEADAPDTAQVRELGRTRRATTGSRLDVDAEGSTGGGAIADREWRIDSRLSSGLIDDEWRVFYDQSLGRGDTSIGNARWARSGLGLNWQRGPWLAEGTVQGSNAGPYRSSAAGRIDYRAADAWRLSATFDGDSKELPWKARVAGIGARETGATIGHVVNEARRFDVQWRRLDFSDGNLRNALDLTWRERWVSTPRFQLETRLGGGTSHSRQQAVPYFSPSRDASTELTVRAQWLHWKRDDRQFFQAVEASGGRYHQAGFGAGPLWSLRYEHKWLLGPKLTLRYGLGISGHPYDGVRERQRSVFMNLSMPLP